VKESGEEVKKKKPKIGPASKVKRSPSRSPEENRSSDTKIRDTETKVKDSETKVKDTETKVKDTETKVKDMETKVKDTETKVKESEGKVKNIDTKDRDTETKVKSSEATSKTKDGGELSSTKPKIGPASKVKKTATSDDEDQARKKEKEEKHKEKEKKGDKLDKKEEKKGSSSIIRSSFIADARKLLEDSDLSDSDDDENKDEKKIIKEKKPEKVKEKKRTSVDTDDFLASDSEEKAKKKKKHKLKDLIKGLSPNKAKTSSGDGEATIKSPQVKRSIINKSGGGGLAMEGRVFEHDNPDGPKCFKCDVTCKDAANLKNHILSHYYQVFYAVLPGSKPFSCPDCDMAPARDKITLTRHYAFSHRKIFEMTDVTPEHIQFTGKGGGRKRRSKGEGGESATPKPKKMKISSSSDKHSAPSKTLISKAFVDSSDDEDEGEVKKKETDKAVKPENKIITFGKIVDEKEKLKKKHKKKDKEREKDRDGEKKRDKKHKNKEKDRDKSKKHKKDKDKEKDKENPLLRLIADLKGSDSSSNEGKSLTVGPSWDVGGEEAAKKGTGF